MILANKANWITTIPWFCSAEVLFDSFLQEHFTLLTLVHRTFQINWDFEPQGRPEKFRVNQ